MNGIFGNQILRNILVSFPSCKFNFGGLKRIENDMEKNKYRKFPHVCMGDYLPRIE